VVAVAAAVLGALVAIWAGLGVALVGLAVLLWQAAISATSMARRALLRLSMGRECLGGGSWCQ
jgi:hypothetical protein